MERYAREGWRLQDIFLSSFFRFSAAEPTEVQYRIIHAELSADELETIENVGWRYAVSARTSLGEKPDFYVFHAPMGQDASIFCPYDEKLSAAEITTLPKTVLKIALCLLFYFIIYNALDVFSTGAPVWVRYRAYPPHRVFLYVGFSLLFIRMFIRHYILTPYNLQQAVKADSSQIHNPASARNARADMISDIALMILLLSITLYFWLT